MYIATQKITKSLANFIFKNHGFWYVLKRKLVLFINILAQVENPMNN